MSSEVEHLSWHQVKTITKDSTITFGHKYRLIATKAETPFSSQVVAVAVLIDEFSTNVVKSPVVRINVSWNMVCIWRYGLSYPISSVRIN